MNPDLNIITYAVSDLGTGPGLSGLIFSTGLIIASFCQIPLYISLIYYLRKKRGNVFLIRLVVLGSLISILSHNFLSIVPFDRTILFLYYIHGIAVGTHYVAGSVSLILFGYIELSRVKVSKFLMIPSFITGALYATLWIGYLLDFLVGIDDYLIIADLKPHGKPEIMKSIPQLLAYAFMLKERLRELNGDKNLSFTILCLGFSKDEAWVFNPDDVKKEILYFMVKEGVKAPIISSTGKLISFLHGLKN